MTQEQSKATTTDAGIPVESDEHPLTVGPDGPILLQDHYLIEQMANFNRERIPERRRAGEPCPRQHAGQSLNLLYQQARHWRDGDGAGPSPLPAQSGTSASVRERGHRQR